MSATIKANPETYNIKVMALERILMYSMSLQLVLAMAVRGRPSSLGIV